MNFNFASILVLLIVLIAVVSVIVYMKTHRIKSCGMCSGDCESCHKAMKTK